MQTEVTTLLDESGVVIETTERKLYTITELKNLNGSEETDHRAYENALEWVAEGNMEFWSGLDELDAYIVPEHFGLAGISCKAKDIQFIVGDRGEFLGLPRNTDVNVPIFLRAMKAYFMGLDYRGKPYASASRKLVATGTGIDPIDLRSRDARIVRDQGLVVLSNEWRGNQTREFDFDYLDLSEAFEADCNEFLAELVNEALRILTDDFEDQSSEEVCFDNAEANEYTFDRRGKRA